MVNREKRDLAGSLLKEFLACEITNDDFADGYPRDKQDTAIGAVYEGLWGFLDDRHTHKLEGKCALDPKAKALFERCVAFLDSDLEYEWPAIQRVSLSSGLLRLIGLHKIADKKADEQTDKMNSFGKLEVWPFIREEDLARVSPSRRVRAVATGERVN
jgi:hypothetical protein